MDGSFYKGHTADMSTRLQRHNNGETKSTRHKRPWKLVYLEARANKSAAILRELSLKKANHERIYQLIASPQNLASAFTQD